MGRRKMIGWNHTIHIEKAQLEKLREHSEETGAPMAELMRRAIREKYPAERRRDTEPREREGETEQRQLHIDEAQWERLREHSEDTGVPISKLIRRAVREKYPFGTAENAPR